MKNKKPHKKVSDFTPEEIAIYNEIATAVSLEDDAEVSLNGRRKICWVAGVDGVMRPHDCKTWELIKQ